jgi:hypothetical protein
MFTFALVLASNKLPQSLQNTREPIAVIVTSAALRWRVLLFFVVVGFFLKIDQMIGARCTVV